MQYPLEQNWTIDNYTVNGGFDQQHPYGPQTQNDDDNASGILMFYMWMILYFILIRREGQMELAHEELELQRQQRGGRELATFAVALADSSASKVLDSDLEGVGESQVC